MAATVTKLSTNYKGFRELEEYPPMMDAKDVKEFLRISLTQTYYFLNSPICPVTRIGKRVMILRDSFDTFIKSNEGKQLLERL